MTIIFISCLFFFQQILGHLICRKNNLTKLLCISEFFPVALEKLNCGGNPFNMQCILAIYTVPELLEKIALRRRKLRKYLIDKRIAVFSLVQILNLYRFANCCASRCATG